MRLYMNNNCCFKNTVAFCPFLQYFNVGVIHLDDHSHEITKQHVLPQMVFLLLLCWIKFTCCPSTKYYIIPLICTSVFMICQSCLVPIASLLCVTGYDFMYIYAIFDFVL